MKASVLFVLVTSIAAALPASAQSSGRTIIGDITAFDPVPGHFTPEEMVKIKEMARQLWAKRQMMPDANAVTIKEVKAWPRLNGDGFIVCALYPGSAPTGPAADIVSVLSVSTGRFAGFEFHNVYDENAYNLLGCNTPGATQAE